MSLLRMPPTKTEIAYAQLGIEAAEYLGLTPPPRMVECANFPMDQASPESEWPTIGRAPDQYPDA